MCLFLCKWQVRSSAVVSAKADFNRSEWLKWSIHKKTHWLDSLNPFKILSVIYTSVSCLLTQGSTPPRGNQDGSCRDVKTLMALLLLWLSGKSTSSSGCRMMGIFSAQISGETITRCWLRLPWDFTVSMTQLGFIVQNWWKHIWKNHQNEAA